MTQSERRSLGRFDTPRPLAQAITEWAVRNQSDHVLEPSVGGGAFATSIVSRLKQLGATSPENLITVCDIDQRALDETARIIDRPLRVSVLGDFLSKNLEGLGNRHFDAIVGNPPYVRLHAMDLNARAVARQSLPSNQILDAKASLWAYFPIHSHKMLKMGGRAAWVLPETILHAGYGKQLLQWAAKNYMGCRVLSLRERCFKQAGAKERVVILLLDGAGIPGGGEVEMAEVSNVYDCIKVLTDPAHQFTDSMPKLNGHTVTHLLSVEASDVAHALENNPDVKRFGDLVDVKIGVVTGDNRFFVVSEEQRKNTGLPRRHFRQVVRKFANLGLAFEFNACDDYSHSGCDWLLYPDPQNLDKKLLDHLARYPLKSRESNRTMAKRPFWHTPLLGRTPDAFLRYMGKTGPRLVLNTAGVLCTNTIHCIYFETSVTSMQRKAICLAAHSTYSQLSAEIEGRQYGSGVLKLEPSEARRLCLPANEAVLESLGESWKTIEDNARRFGWEEVVSEIDQIVVNHCPALADSLPLNDAENLLNQLKSRRTGDVILSEGKKTR